MDTKYMRLGHRVWYTDYGITSGTAWFRHCNCGTTVCTRYAEDVLYNSMDDFIRDLDTEKNIRVESEKAMNGR
jgi:hypothetical protein